MQKGYIQVYTGDGKGKTTAAMGLALRAVGAGFKVFFGQFMKGQDYSELKAFRHLDQHLAHHQFGSEEWVYQDKENVHARKLAEEGLQQCKEAIMSGTFDVVILDEINVALFFHLLQWPQVEEMLKQKPEHVELVCTGRGAPPELIELADLVTEMKAVKHYYEIGVTARRGIEN